MKVKYTFNIDAELLKALKILAINEYMPLNQLLTDILEKYLTDELLKQI